MPNPLRVATVNVNGIRAAFRNGMDEWLVGRNIDILALQEVRAADTDVEALFPTGWHILHDPATAKGRAGVAVISRNPAIACRTALGSDGFDSAGRWLEADFSVNGTPITIVSTYVHSGEDGTPKQVEKYKFLESMKTRMSELAAGGRHVAVMGDLNVAHRSLDIKNWRGNLKKAGFLPEERAYFDHWIGVEGTDSFNSGSTGWVDVGRRWVGEVDGPYTWWSVRGQAFDTDTGWRIDYQLATTALAETVEHYVVDRAKSYAERWSDHAPVVVDYSI